MKRYAQAVFIATIVVAVLAIAIVYINSLKSATNEGEPVRYRSFEASQAPGTQAASASQGGQDVLGQPKLSSAIPLEEGETLLDLYSFNLDFDDEEEQVLVTRRAQDASGAMRLVVADYIPPTRRWSRSWEGITSATQVKTFQVSAVDLIGDHNLNLVCTGMNNLGEQTMTVFWRGETGDGRQGPRFSKIFEDAGNTVLVEAAERSESYKMGQTNADSWPILVWKPDAESENFTDQVKESWAWNFSERRYVIMLSERIAGSSIARKLAESILDGTSETFEQWLEGIWFQEGTDPLSPDALFLTFEPRSRTVLFSRASIIELYSWESSSPTRMGLYLATRNRSVGNLRRLMDVELETSDSIRVRVFQDLRIKADITDRWDGRYRKLSPEAAKAFRLRPSAAHSESTNLDGTWLGPSGEQFVVTGSRYQLFTKDGTEHGGLAAYTLADSTLLDMRAVTLNGQPSKAMRSYFLAMRQEGEDKESSTTVMELSPARVGIEGAMPADGQKLTLRRE